MDKIFKIERYKYSLETALGRLLTPESHIFCRTLEDTPRAEGIKVYTYNVKTGQKEGCTAIPGGYPGNPMRYKLTIAESTRFKRGVVYLSNTSDYWRISHKGVEYKGCLFHGGNDHTHTDGCPLIAYSVDEDKFKIWGSAEKEFTELVRQYQKEGHQCYVDVINLPATIEIKI